MKLKFAVMTGLVAVAMVGLVGCATVQPEGTVLIGGINWPYGRIYAFEEYVAEFPHDKELIEKLKLDPRGKFVKYSLLKDVFGGGDFNVAYVPPELAQKIKKGDIVKVVSAKKGVTPNIVAELNPPGCEWKGGGYVSAKVVYCYGKDSMVTPPEGGK